MKAYIMNRLSGRLFGISGESPAVVERLMSRELRSVVDGLGLNLEDPCCASCKVSPCPEGGLDVVVRLDDSSAVYMVCGERYAGWQRYNEVTEADRIYAAEYITRKFASIPFVSWCNEFSVDDMDRDGAAAGKYMVVFKLPVDNYSFCVALAQLAADNVFYSFGVGRHKAEEIFCSVEDKGTAVGVGIPAADLKADRVVSRILTRRARMVTRPGRAEDADAVRFFIHINQDGSVGECRACWVRGGEESEIPDIVERPHVIRSARFDWIDDVDKVQQACDRMCKNVENCEWPHYAQRIAIRLGHYRRGDAPLSLGVFNFLKGVLKASGLSLGNTAQYDIALIALRSMMVLAERDGRKEEFNLL